MGARNRSDHSKSASSESAMTYSQFLQMFPTAGTIFHKSTVSLHLWFHAIFLMASTRCGISAKQLEREIGVTYKTAWRMFHRIREMLMDPTDDRFDGEIE